jgi:hypothetical protein
MLGENVNAVTKTTEALLDASRKTGPELETKYMDVSLHNIGPTNNLLIYNKCFESGAKFKHSFLGSVTNKNCIHGEIKSRLNSENACHHSSQSVLSSHLFHNFTCCFAWM